MSRKPQSPPLLSATRTFRHVRDLDGLRSMQPSNAYHRHPNGYIHTYAARFSDPCAIPQFKEMRDHCTADLNLLEALNKLNL